MTHPRVLCLGEILLDCLADQVGKTFAEVESWTLYPGGAPANVACALTKLGTKAGFIGCVGQDEAGEELLKLLQDVGVDVTGVQRHPTAPTRKVYVLRSLSGERTFAGFGELKTTDFADAFLKSSALPVELLEHAEFLVLGTLGLAYPDTREALARALHLAEQHYVKILIDVNWRPVFWPQPDEAPERICDLLKHADFVKLSEEEAEWLFDTKDPGAIAAKLGHSEGVLVTAGAGGCRYCLGENEGHVSAFSVDVEDTTGAGDSFVAGFIHQVCQQGIKNLQQPEIAKQIIQYANAVGALTTTKPGAIAAQPTAAEVDAFLYLQQIS
ncbi:MAG: carbohydrate kinase [Oscillatoriaceae bacterium SKW80]|nr:carbohydrate kinase [Oscillatoriaceae bacterium SKYG93]MCX8119315.1 carbohydrate kinase [Oscillatoriaceae bacterium SKW80]MDW8454782.1 carbohydrate kinase [Oscillatoriaceae cyanobacterium SKYGB_i_bin93]HIK28437.1 carbohydrate kinase [Oscillatoriaceae cyanobacterium M7585_C2015_266]